MTVLAELQRRFPGDDYLYFGDTANVPYGTKSPTQIRALSKAAAEKILLHQPDCLVIACNTASSCALDVFESVLGKTPVLGVVAAGVAAILSAQPNPHSPILVLATKATIRSHVYRDLLQATTEFSDGKGLYEQACPLLVPLIEENWNHHPVLDQVLAEYVKPYRALPPGIALLGCTHYPWIREAFERALPGWKVIDSAHSVTEELAKNHSPSTNLTGEAHWIFTDPEAIPEFAMKIIRASAGSVGAG